MQDLMSKTFARSSLCALSMTIMTAHAAEPPTNLDKPEGRLDIIAWPGYIERGQTDKQYDWVTQFEKETGCAVNVKTAATSDEMVSLMILSRVIPVLLNISGIMVIGQWVASPIPKARLPQVRPIAEIISQLPEVRASS